MKNALSIGNQLLQPPGHKIKVVGEIRELITPLSHIGSKSGIEFSVSNPSETVAKPTQRSRQIQRE